jgi:dihydropteroate synthase
MLPASPDNPAGFYDSTEVVLHNQFVLHAARRTWVDCLPFDPDRFDDATRSALAEKSPGVPREEFAGPEGTDQARAGIDALAPSYWHHVAPEGPACAGRSPVRDMVGTTWSALRDLRDIPMSSVACECLDQVHAAFAAWRATELGRWRDEFRQGMITRGQAGAWARPKSRLVIPTSRPLCSNKVPMATQPKSIPPYWAGLTLDRPRIMGVLNVTPDSFSDGGRTDPDAAISAGLAMRDDGADIVDVGGESARPGATPTPPEIERARILPVIRGLAAKGVLISVDTRHAATMAAALDAGATIVNDITALSHDPGSAPLVAARGCPVVLMHMRGTPATMMGFNQYQDVAADVMAELSDRVAAAERAGIRREAIVIDPGFGFAKHPPQSLALLRDLAALTTMGLPILAGVSRKGFIRGTSGEADPARNFPGSIAAGLFALAQGAAMLRVHDVRETVRAVRVWHALTTKPLSRG